MASHLVGAKPQCCTTDDFMRMVGKLYGNVEYGCSFHFVRLIRKLYDDVEFVHLFHLSLTHLCLVIHIKASVNWVIIDSHNNAQAKPLAEPMLTYCQLGSWEHISMKFE